MKTASDDDLCILADDDFSVDDTHSTSLFLTLRIQAENAGR